MKPNICIAAVGGLKEAALIQAADSCLKRLKPICDISIIEVPDDPAPEHLSGSGRQATLERESGRILSRLMPFDIKAPLAIEGRLADMPFFCELINKAEFECRRLDFIIGGSLGLAESVLMHSYCKISLSRLTFPHRLTRLLLLEIICQALKV